MAENNKKIILSNFIYNLLYQVVRMILPLVTIPYVTRTLGAEMLGIYNYTYAIATYFAMAGYLGYENYGNRLIAKSRSNQNELNKAFTGAYLFQVCSGIIAIISYAVFVLDFMKSNSVIAFIQILYVGSELFNVSWFYFGMEKFRRTAAINITVRLISFLAIITFVKKPDDLPIYTFICSFTFLFCSLLLWFGIHKYVKFSKVSLGDILKHARGTLILFFPVLVISIYRSMDKIMLGNMTTMVDVALYSNADKVVEIPYGVITALGVVMIPRMTKLMADGDLDQTNRYIEISMRFMLFLACGMSFGMIGIGKVFAPIFFGNEFIDSGPLIMIIAPTVIVRACANVIRTQYLLPAGRDKDYIISILIGAVINITFNLLMIPHWKSTGAAVATFMAESFVAFYQIFACRKDIPVARYTFRNWLFLIAGGIMCIFVYYFGKNSNTSVMTLIKQVCLGVVIYMVIGGGYLFLTEKQLMKSLLKREKMK